MKKLVSILAILLLLIAGLWGGAAYWFGVKAEQHYHTLLQQASEFQYLRFVSESYNRGFFQSQARTVMEIILPPDSTGETQPLKFTLVQDVTHGPFPLGKFPDHQGQFTPAIAVIETRLAAGSELQGRAAEFWNQIPELGALRDYTIIYLDGNGEERFIIPSFQRAFGKADPVTVDWKGLSLKTNFTADFKGFTGSFNMPAMDVRGKEFDLRITEAKSSFNTQEGISGLWLGEASFTLASLDFTINQELGPQTLLLAGFYMSTSTKASGENINSIITLRTEQLRLDDTQYGPGIFEMDFRNIDAASLAKLQQAIREEHAQASQQPTEAAPMMNFARYLEVLPGLLKKSPEIEIKQFDFKTSLGDFTSKARIAFDGTKSDAALNPLTVATALTAQAELKIGEGLLRSVIAGVMKDRLAEKGQEIEEDQEADDEDEAEEEALEDEQIDQIASAKTDEQLEALIVQGFLVKGNGTYTAKARYEGGQIVLNDRPLSLQDLLQ